MAQWHKRVKVDVKPVSSVPTINHYLLNFIKFGKYATMGGILLKTKKKSINLIL